MTIPTLEQLKRALHLQEKIEALQKELSSLFSTVGIKALGIAESGMKAATRMIKGKKRVISQAARAKITAAQKKRWAKVIESKPARKKSRMSAAGRAAIVKAQKARWASVRKEQQRK